MRQILKNTSIILLLASMLLGAVEAPQDSAYLEGVQNGKGVILCHGKGKYPTWSVVDPLRKGIHEKLGYHTLSIQMPNEDKNWKEYADDFPDAFFRIEEAVSFLKDKGVSDIYLMGHSMGSRMVSAFIQRKPGCIACRSDCRRVSK